MYIYNGFYQEALLNALNDETQRIQEQVYFGQIKSHTDVLDKFLSEAGIQRYNPRVWYFNHLQLGNLYNDIALTNFYLV